MMNPVFAKSVYVIADLNAGGAIPVHSYDIQGNQIVFQASYGIPNYAGGAVGLGIDTDSKTLFATYEFSNIIQLLDATTMTSLGSTTAPGASNLAGIVVDQDLQKVYTIDRYTNKLYIYSWDATTKVLSLDQQLFLPGVTKAFGLALDEINDLLYVANYNNVIYYFSTSDFTTANTITVARSVIGIAVDGTRGYIYYGAGWAGNYYLGQYDLNSNTENSVYLGSSVGVMGVAVDPATGYIYCSTGYSGDDLRVFDTALNQTDQTGDIGNPTGVAVPGKEVGYNPLQLTKDDGIAAGQCAAIGSNINYTISYNNVNNTQPVTNVVITDYLPAELDYVSVTGGGVYDPVTKTVTWTIGTLPAGYAGASVNLVSTVNINATPGGTVTNTCKIASTETGESTVNETTDICSQVFDQTPPSCTFHAYNPGPPVSIEIQIEDTESGVKTIEVMHLSNATAEIPMGSGNFYNEGDIATFATPITTPIIVKAEKINQSSGASIALKATDDAGNYVTCDPVYTTLFSSAPENFELYANYPNPFNPSTTINFSVATGPIDVTIRVYDISGREVKTLLNEVMNAGQYSVEWDGTNNRGEKVAGGVYLYRMVAGDFVMNRKMMLIK